jgi:tRNA1Val (adenine37-N6)-methyltransferase
MLRKRDGGEQHEQEDGAPMTRAPRRPEGWVAPGPPPRGAQGRPELAPGPDEDLSLLSGDWRVFQQRRGHRWSLDDLVTAEVAASSVPHPPALALDMGCGIGSVLMMVAWRFPETRVVGIEAQELSFGMARRSLAYNGADDRCDVRLGDLREPAMLPEGPVFELVTGTPPYFPIGEGIQSDKPQAGPCRFEHRGGVEDYCAAAARAMAPGGVFVMCAASGEAPRVREGAKAAALDVTAVREIVPREGKPPLVTVFTLRHARAPNDGGHWPDTTTLLVVRDTKGAWTPEFAGVRRAMGMPDRPPRA